MDTTPVDDAEVSYQVFSGSGMWNWNIDPQWSFTGAGRLDHLRLDRSGPIPTGFPLDNEQWDRDITEFSGNAGVVYKATDLDTFRAAYGRDLHLPSLVELCGLQINQGAFGISGGPNLDTAIVTNYELGYDRRLPEIDTQAGLRLFYQENEDLRGAPGAFIDIPPTATTIPLSTFDNIGNSKSYGFELTAGGNISGGFTWDVDYTFQKVDDDLDDIAQRRYANSEDTNPVHMLDLHGGWADGKWEVDAFASYVSTFDGFEDSSVAPQGELVEIDGYFSFAGRVGYWLLDDVQVAVSGQNLISSPQRQTSLTKSERRAFLTLSARF